MSIILLAMRWWPAIILLTLPVFGEIIPTFYGNMEVEEPILLELIYSPALQRLKAIHQYGVAYYTTHKEEYNRFDHSLGVFVILRRKGASLEEQIAGLLHDVSHTVFSHVGDWVFGVEYQENDYQSTIHNLYLAVSGIETILNRYGYSIEQISPKRKAFMMLEQPLPHLSADRIDYNIQGAYFQHFLTREEALELFSDLVFEQGKWLTTKKDLITKVGYFSLFMTENCWGGAVNYVTSRWLAEAICQGLSNGLISWREFHFGIDQAIWDKLCNAQDALIKARIHMILHAGDYFQIVPSPRAHIHVKFRCRGIDPWIRDGEKIVRLTESDPEFAKAFQKTKDRAAKGWPLKMHLSEETKPIVVHES